MATNLKRNPISQPIEAEPTASAAAEAVPAPLAWLTLERLLYALIFGVALVLRLWRLGSYPLSDSEAAQSLVALNLFRGLPVEVEYYSPLLASLNMLTFALFGSSDASARLVTVLLGMALVIAPLTLRRQLGSLVCLLASALLAISPSALYLSRTLNSEVAVATGALLIVAGFFNWTTDGQQRWLWLLAAGLALMLAAGPMAFSVIIIFGLTILLKLSDFKALWQRGLYLSTNQDTPPDIRPVEIALTQQTAAESKFRIRNPAVSPPVPPKGGAKNIPPSGGLGGPTDDEATADSTPSQPPPHRGRGETSPPNPPKGGAKNIPPSGGLGGPTDDEATADSTPSQPPPHRGRGKDVPPSGGLGGKHPLQSAGILFAVLLALFSTAALFNLNGFSMLAASLNQWLTSFVPAETDTAFNAVFLLTIYEPLLIFAGLAGLTLVLMRGSFLGTVLVAWFLGMLLIDIGMAGRPEGNIILILVPLAFLAGLALAELWQNVRDFGSWSNEGILLAAGLAIAAYGYIGLTSWLDRTCGADDLFCQYLWLQPLAALLMFIGIVIFFGLLSGNINAALRGAALTAVVLGLLSTVSIGWRLNYGPLMHLAYQPLTGVTPSPQLLALTDTLAEQSAARVGDRTLLDVTLSGVDSPALRWRLRDYDKLTPAGLNPTAPTTAIITPEIEELGLGEGYIGQDFTLDAAWSPIGLEVKPLFEWLIYREAGTMPVGNKAILWLRVEE